MSLAWASLPSSLLQELFYWTLPRRQTKLFSPRIPSSFPPSSYQPWHQLWVRILIYYMSNWLLQLEEWEQKKDSASLLTSAGFANVNRLLITRWLFIYFYNGKYFESAFCRAVVLWIHERFSFEGVQQNPTWLILLFFPMHFLLLQRKL